MYEPTGITLGEGTFAKVIEVVKDGVVYAKKQFNENIEENNKQYERRMMEMTKKCKYIIHLVDVEENGDLITTKMDGTLLDLINSYKYVRKCIPELVLMDMTRHVLLGLSFLSKHNIVHCDLKPENILYKRTSNTQSGYQFVVSDLGNSLFASNTNRLAIQTVEYRCMENLLGSTRLDTCCDIMSLGCILFECVVGYYIVYATDEEKYKHVMNLLDAVGNKILKQCDTSELPEIREYLDDVITEDGIAPLLPYYYKKNGYVCGTELTDLILSMLIPFPTQRISLDDALDHSWLDQELPMNLYDDLELIKTYEHREHSEIDYSYVM